jgi:hypothetical protein
VVRVGVTVSVRVRDQVPPMYHIDKFGRTCLRIYSYSKFKGGAHADLSTFDPMVSFSC